MRGEAGSKKDFNDNNGGGQWLGRAAATVAAPLRQRDRGHDESKKIADRENEGTV